MLGQQVIFAQRDLESGPVQTYSMDAWDGHVASRDRPTRGWVDVGVRNAIVLAGDVHRHWASELKLDYDDPDAPAVGTELVTTSITSFGDGIGDGPEDNPVVAENIKFYADRRGYVRTRFTPSEVRTDFRSVPTSPSQAPPSRPGPRSSPPTANPASTPPDGTCLPAGRDRQGFMPLVLSLPVVPTTAEGTHEFVVHLEPHRAWPRTTAPQATRGLSPTCTASMTIRRLVVREHETQRRDKLLVTCAGDIIELLKPVQHRADQLVLIRSASQAVPRLSRQLQGHVRSRIDSPDGSESDSRTRRGSHFARRLPRVISLPPSPSSFCRVR